MNKLEDTLITLFKPGTATGKFFYGLLFFLIGLLFAMIGFWKTILIAALTLLGVLFGSAETIGKAVAKVLDKVYPPKDRKVVYTKEDLDKVKKAAEIKRESLSSAQEPSDNKQEKEKNT